MANTLTSGNCHVALANALFFANKPPMANQIKALRKDRLTLEELSEATGISISYLSRIEAGKRGLSLENTIKIARALGVEPVEVTNEFLPEDLDRAAQMYAVDQADRPHIGDIPNFTIHAGMGPGGALSVVKNNEGEIYSEHSDGFWSFPDAVKAGWRNMARIYAMPVVGDPTLPGGSFVFVDTSHNVPAPEDIYAIDYGDGLMVKRVKLIPRTENLLVISDNPRYDDDELSRADVRVYGRVVASFQWRG